MSQSPIPTLVVMARWPASGRCKSRLAVDIGSEQAAIIQQRLTAHTFAVAEALNEQGDVDVQVAMSGVSLRSAQRSSALLTALHPRGSGTGIAWGSHAPPDSSRALQAAATSL